MKNTARWVLLVSLPFTQVRFKIVAVFDGGVHEVSVFMERFDHVFDFYVVEHDVANGVLLGLQM